jgi:hypothetical protein
MDASAYLVSITNICCAALVVGGSLQRLKGREELIANSRHKAVLHLRYEDELAAFKNAKEQCIKAMPTRNVTANDGVHLLALLRHAAIHLYC